MLGVTFFGLVLTPVFYVLVRGVGLRTVPVTDAQVHVQPEASPPAVLART
jgi:hypothetical protein